MEHLDGTNGIHMYHPTGASWDERGGTNSKKVTHYQASYHQHTVVVL